MLKRVLFITAFCAFCLIPAAAGVQQVPPAASSGFTADSTRNDTVYPELSFFTDTLRNEHALELIFKPYRAIRHSLEQTGFTIAGESERKVPTIKEVRVRDQEKQVWIFWFSVALLLFISFARISNPRQFETFVAAVFDMQANEKLWNDKNRNYLFLYLAFFLFYISTLSFFMTIYSVKEGLIKPMDYLALLASTFVSLLVLYTCKFAVYFISGFLIDTGKLVSAIVASIVSINAFVSLVLFPLVVFYAYSTDGNISSMFYHTIFTVFVLGLIYRFIRFITAGNSYFRYSNIYLFVYLCALEICPWLIILKLFKHYLS